MMSRAVYLACTQCGPPGQIDCSDSINHGEKELRELWASRALVRSLWATQAWYFADVRPAATSHDGDWFRWIATHAEHQVILRDEYGGTAPIDATHGCIREDE
jgi:hypothetical protein